MKLRGISAFSAKLRLSDNSQLSHRRWTDHFRMVAPRLEDVLELTHNLF